MLVLDTPWEPSKPTVLEVFMVKTWVFRWPKPLFFMVLGGKTRFFSWVGRGLIVIQFDEHVFQMGWFNHQLEDHQQNLKRLGLLIVKPLPKKTCRLYGRNPLNKRWSTWTSSDILKKDPLVGAWRMDSQLVSSYPKDLGPSNGRV